MFNILIEVMPRPRGLAEVILYWFFFFHLKELEGSQRSADDICRNSLATVLTLERNFRQSGDFFFSSGELRLESGDFESWFDCSSQCWVTHMDQFLNSWPQTSLSLFENGHFNIMLADIMSWPDLIRSQAPPFRPAGGCAHTHSNLPLCLINITLENVIWSSVI